MPIDTCVINCRNFHGFGITAILAGVVLFACFGAGGPLGHDPVLVVHIGGKVEIMLYGNRAGLSVVTRGAGAHFGSGGFAGRCLGLFPIDDHVAGLGAILVYVDSYDLLNTGAEIPILGLNRDAGSTDRMYSNKTLLGNSGDIGVVTGVGKVLGCTVLGSGIQSELFGIYTHIVLAGTGNDLCYRIAFIRTAVNNNGGSNRDVLINDLEILGRDIDATVRTLEQVFIGAEFTSPVGIM